MSTYPYLPGLPDDEDENSASALSRKRLASFARVKKPPAATQAQKEKESSTPTGNAISGAPPPAGRKDGMESQKSLTIPKPVTSVIGPEGKTATRSDVKETLKSMGLRCEDFTISVYSREQAHAILRRQGVEVTPNNLPAREKLAAMTGKGGYRNAQPMQRMPHNMRTLPPTNTWPANTRAPNIRAPNTRKMVPRYEEDDDDCVILDPPDAPKPPPPALPQQFQLMGTTVQVNRGAKRPNRPMMNQPQAKRLNARPMQYYHKDHEEYGAEASVQDTLKRLKNYNISITCRRNASGFGPRGPMESDSDMDEEGHMDSEEEEDMTKYLECQIGEIDDIPEQEVFEEEEIDCDDKDDVDYNPKGKKKKKNKTPRKDKRSLGPVYLPSEPTSESGVDPLSESGMEVCQLDSSTEVIENQETDKQSSEVDQESKTSSPMAPASENDNDEAIESAEKNSEQSDAEGEQRDFERNPSDNPEEDPSQHQEEEEECEEKEAEEEEEEKEQEQEQEENKGEEESGENNEEFSEERDDGAAEVSTECETKDDNTDIVEDMIDKEMKENQAQDGPDDDEIDDELEKKLLAGDVGDEGDMEEDL